MICSVFIFILAMNSSIEFYNQYRSVGGNVLNFMIEANINKFFRLGFMFLLGVCSVIGSIVWEAKSILGEKNKLDIIISVVIILIGMILIVIAGRGFLPYLKILFLIVLISILFLGCMGTMAKKGIAYSKMLFLFN